MDVEIFFKFQLYSCWTIEVGVNDRQLSNVFFIHGIVRSTYLISLNNIAFIDKVTSKTKHYKVSKFFEKSQVDF